MTVAHWTKHLRPAASVAALGLVVLMTCAGGSARAADAEGNSIYNLDRRILQGILRGLGLRRADEESIDYRERSPLVVPPTRDLPSPEGNVAEQNPAWPVDIDVKRRGEVAARRKVGATAYDPEAEAQNLMPHQLAAGKRTGRTTQPDPNNPRSDADVEGNVVKPSALGYFGGLFNSFGGRPDEVASFRAEPPRASLTAPPPGYQTPAATAPYGVTKRNEYGKAGKVEDLPSSN